MKIYTWQVGVDHPVEPASLKQMLKELDVNEEELDRITDLTCGDSVVFIDGYVITRVDTPVDHAE
jgi:hypothetical protein